MTSTLRLKKTIINHFYKSFSKSGVLFLGLLLLTAFQSNAQVSAYGYQEFNGVSDGEVYTPISGTDLFGPTPLNQFTPIGSEVPLGFTFNYNGINYSNVKVHSNGFIYFGGTINTTAAQAAPISGANANQYAGAIAGYSRSLFYSSYGSAPIYSAVTHPSSVEYLTNGVVGSRVFTVQYKNMTRNNGTLSAREGLLNFQIKLFEGTNVVEIIYDQQIVTGPATTNLNLVGQCGLRGLLNTDFNNRIANSANYLLTNAGGANNLGINYRNTSNAGTVIRMQWTPPCYAPSGLSAVNLTGTTADISWTAPAIAPTSYQFEVRSSGAPGSGPVGLGNSGTVAGTSTVATGLSQGFTYRLYVRSFCGGSSYSAWVTGPLFTLPCAATNVPYYIPFDPIGDGFTVPGLPVCTVNQNAGAGNNWVSSPADFSAFFDEHLTYTFHPTNNANTWFITKGVNLTAGQTYRIQYIYGGSSEFTYITNRMEVRYGTTGTAAGLAGAIQIDNHPDIKSVPETNIVNFTAPTTDVYYFGFRAYSLANNGTLYLDDIFIDVSNCLAPTGLTAPAVLVSFNNATITWTAPSPSPTGGYAYYYNTTGVAPTNGTPASGTVPAGTTLTAIPGLTPNTTYYVWVRSICGPTEFGEWSANTTFTTLPAPPVYCIPAGTSIDGQGITNVTFGSINNTTGSEVATSYYGDYSGLTANVAQGATIPVAITFNTAPFDYNTHIWIDWNNDGDFFDTGELVYTGLSGTTNPSVLNASFTVPLSQPLGPRRMRIGGTDFGPFANPCRTDSWQSYEDYTINVIVAPPALTLSQTTMPAQCGLTNSPLVTITSNLADLLQT